MKRRFVTLLLCIALTITSIVPAFADEIVNEEVVLDEADIEDESVETVIEEEIIEDESADNVIEEEIAEVEAVEDTTTKVDANEEAVTDTVTYNKDNDDGINTNALEDAKDDIVIDTETDNVTAEDGEAEDGETAPKTDAAFNYRENGYERQTNKEKYSHDRKKSAKYTDGVAEDGYVLPVSYSSLDKNYLPNLRDQGDYGTCWAHSAMAAAETNLHKQEVTIAQASSPNIKDYSERALAWFLNSKAGVVEDPLGGFEGDNNYRVDGKWWKGNNFWLSSDLLMGWVGATEESLAPYSGMPTLTEDENGDVIGEGGAVSNDIAISSSVAHLDTFDAVPKTDRDQIKRSIMFNGLGLMVYYACGWKPYEEFTYVDEEGNRVVYPEIVEAGGADMVTKELKPFFTYEEAAGKRSIKIDDNACYYCPVKGAYIFANHAVTVVGWDDNFSKDNFNSGNARPQNDGAWLIRNSWTTNDNERSHRGYFWISYEDESIDEYVGFMHFEREDQSGDNIYQYDGSVWDACIEDVGEVKVANVFTVQADGNGEKLQAIAYDSDSENVDVFVDVYLNPDLSTNDPTSGLLVSHTETERTYMGYKKVYLDQPVPLRCGDTYSVVVTVSGTEGETVYLNAEGTATNDDGYFVICEAGIKPGQSYVKNNSNDWTDLYDIDRIGNAKIKGYTWNIDIYSINYHSNTDEEDKVNTLAAQCDGGAIIYGEMFSQIGMKQIGWNTEPDGTGEFFEFESITPPEFSVGVNGEIDLYAQWEAVPNGWYDVDSHRVYILDGKCVKNAWKEIDGKCYRFDSDGYMLTGWQKIDGKWYYLDTNGVKHTGWIGLNGKKYYLNANGVMQTDWIKQNNKWYYLNANGVMQTGWIKQNNKWYYLNANGVMQTGWIKQNNKWYYLNANGVMQTGWIKQNNKWYYLNANGVMQTGWIKQNNKWYYLNANGVMQTGWVKQNNKWYYLNANGVMQTGWIKLNGKEYYLYSDGHMAVNEWISGKYHVNADGVYDKQR